MAKDNFSEIFLNALLKQCQEMKDNGSTDEQIEKKLQELDITKIYQNMLEQTSDKAVSIFKEDMSNAYENYILTLNDFTKELTGKWGNCFDFSYMMYAIVLEAMDRYCKYCVELEKEDVNNVSGKIYLFHSLREICARACQEYLEIFTLIRVGLADGAYARCRSIDELSIIAQFICEYGEETAQSFYMASFTDDKYNWAKTASCYTPKQKAESYNLNFTDIRINCKRLPKEWKNHYSALNKAVHASPQGTFGRIGIKNGTYSLGVGHSIYGIEQPAIHAAFSLYIVSHLFFSLFSSSDILIMQKGIEKWYQLIKEKYTNAATEVNSSK